MPDPSAYFDPYTRQIRGLASQNAQGRPVSTSNPTFRVPGYYRRPEPGQEIGSHFDTGGVYSRYSSAATFAESFQTPGNSGRRLESRMAVPPHVNLESPTGQFLKQSLGLPYEENSRIDIGKAVRFFKDAFSEKAVDARLAGAFQAVHKNGFVAKGLETADVLAGDIHEGVAGFVQKTPFLRKNLEQAALRRDSYAQEAWESHTHFGKAYGDFGHAVADLFGAASPAQGTPLSQRQLAVSKGVLKYLVGPAFLFGMGFAPLIHEVHKKIREAGDERAKHDSEEHHNLETRTGQFLKASMGLPYMDRSVVDLEKVTEFFSDLAKKYPSLVGRPREVAKTFYSLQTQAYEYFAQHENKALSFLARSLLFSKKAEHLLDYSYRLSPMRFLSSVFRAAAGIEHRSYEKLAFEGLAGAADANMRRAIKLTGFTIGTLETVFNYQHLYREIQTLLHRIFPQEDPDQKERNRLAGQRRKDYREARKKGLKYDPTLPGRMEKKGESFVHTILEELRTQFSPRYQIHALKTNLKDPKRHPQAIAMYGAFLALSANRVYETVKGHPNLRGAELGGKIVGEYFEKHALRMQFVTGAGALAGIVFGRSATARTGAFANLGATILADAAGHQLGKWAARTEAGQRWASKIFRAVSKIPRTLEIDHPYTNRIAGDFEKYADAILHKAGDSASKAKALEITEMFFSKAGMEVAGVLLEGTLLIPIRHMLRRLGESYDRRKAFRDAHGKAKKHARDDREKKERRHDTSLQDFLGTYTTTAYGERDILTNPNYSSTQRMALLAIRRNDYGKGQLDVLGSLATRQRRVRAGLKVFRNPHLFEKGRKEDWRLELSRAYASPAYTDADISSNPAYSSSDRGLLFLLKRTAQGRRILEAVSPKVTTGRKIRAWAKSLGHPKDVGSSGGNTLLRHVSNVAEAGLRSSGDAGNQAVDVLQGIGQAAGRVKDAHQKIRKRHGREKLKVRSRLRLQDADLNEKMLHRAYSRQMDYGHEGNTLSAEQYN